MGKLEKYSSYKDSGVEWLGEIPEHWEIIKLGYFFGAKKGINAAKLTKEFCGKVQGNYNVYSGQTENNGVMDSINFFEFNYEKEGCLFTTTVGAKAMTLKYLQEKFSLSQNCMIMFSRKNVIDVKFFYYHLQPLFLYERKFIPEHMQASFRMEDFYQFKSALPPKNEQIKIASFLDEKTAQIDEVISQKEKLIELLKERKQIVINDAVTKGLDKDVEFVDSGVEWIGKIPKHWEAKTIKALFEERREMNKPIKTDNILSLCMYRGVIPYAEKGSGGNKAKEDLTAYKIAHPDDIVLNSMNVIAGSVGLSKYYGIVSPVYYMLHRRDKNDSIMFYSYIFRNQSFQKSLIRLGNGILIKKSELTGKLNTIRLKIPMIKLNREVLPYPPQNEQIQIAEYIETQIAKIDKAIELQQNYISKLKEYKASLIDSVVTGKVKVA